MNISLQNSITKLYAWAMLIVMLSFIIMWQLRLPEPLLWVFRLGILGVFFFNIKAVFKLNNIDKLGLQFTLVFIGWLLIGFVRATFYADGYWMWKSVISQLLNTLFYVIILISTNILVVQKYLQLYLKYFIPIMLLSIISPDRFTWMNYLPVLILMLFFGLLLKRKQILLIGLVVFIFVVTIQRNDLIKILFVSLLGILISYYYNYIPRKIFSYVRISLLAIPFLLLALGVLGIFNVFKMDEYIKGNYTQTINTSEGVEIDDLKVDTRTFIYVNVFETLNRYDAFIAGRSPAFGDEGVDNSWGRDSTTGLKGRYGNEVGVLDILLWYGVIGVILYFLLYVRASYLAIYRSRSRYAKGVGIYVAFLWVWAFVWEKPLFETFFMVDLMLLGLCFSKSFRAMTDAEMRIWVNGIFYKTYSNPNKLNSENENTLAK